MTAYDISSRLAILLLHYPRLRLIWSTSPQESGRIFAALKRSRANPKVPTSQAAAVGDGEREERMKCVSKSKNTSSGKLAIQELLLRIPQISTQHLGRIFAAASDESLEYRICTLRQLARATREQLTSAWGAIFEPSQLDAIHHFLHNPPQ